MKVLELASERVFVPLTVGGGIRSYTDDNGKVMPPKLQNIFELFSIVSLFSSF